MKVQGLKLEIFAFHINISRFNLDFNTFHHLFRKNTPHLDNSFTSSLSVCDVKSVKLKLCAV